MLKKLLFLTLNTFSATGGIEKVCRAAGKALHEIIEGEKGELAIYSLYDQNKDVLKDYFPSSVFEGFAGKKLKFVLQSISKGRSSDVVILSHINLLAVGYLVKKSSPKIKLVLLAHGIEVWDRLSSLKMRMIKSVDLLLPVSNYTSEKLRTVLEIPATRLQVLNNCLDPFLQKASLAGKDEELAERYSIKKGDVVLLTLTRIKFSEQYKGYDKVIRALATLQKTEPRIKYLVVGKYDNEEKARLDSLIDQADLNDRVIFTGFVSDDELAAHFNIADVYIMPSTGEGFGIVFIEALFYGKPVIAGNKDGSVDALANGEFGFLVNPDNNDEIIAAINKVLANKEVYLPDEKKVTERFGFEQYKKQWATILYPNEAGIKTVNRNNQATAVTY